MRLHAVKRADGWWVEGLPAYRVNGETCTACGPYRTRSEAYDDRRGMERFYRDYAAKKGQKRKPGSVCARGPQAELFNRGGD